MSHTYCSALFHCVFSTENRAKSISPDLQERLGAFMAGIARKQGMKLIAVGGMEDHVHLLLSIPSSKPLAQGLREIKSGSSCWMKETGGEKGFQWQEGYGAFSVGCSQVNTTLPYIARQNEHHRKNDFQAEFIAFLKKHRIDYDPKYIFD
jgi:REP element-mobilizing transposase RayT